jgi:hypothetical protein
MKSIVQQFSDFVRGYPADVLMKDPVIGLHAPALQSVMETTEGKHAQASLVVANPGDILPEFTREDEAHSNQAPLQDFPAQWQEVFMWVTVMVMASKKAGVALVIHDLQSIGHSTKESREKGYFDKCRKVDRDFDCRNSNKDIRVSMNTTFDKIRSSNSRVMTLTPCVGYGMFVELRQVVKRRKERLFTNRLTSWGVGCHEFGEVVDVGKFMI